MSATGRSDVRNEQDFYETPYWCTRAVLRYLAPKMTPDSILEPCAGRGSIVSELITMWPMAKIMAVEQNPSLLEFCPVVIKRRDMDFLEMPVPWSGEYWYDLCITNPPYRKDLLLPIINHALSMSRHVVMLVRVNWVVGGKSRDTWREEHPCDMLTLSRRPEFQWVYSCKKCAEKYAVAPGSVNPEMCSRCGCESFSVVKSDATEYCWAHWHACCRREWHPLDCRDRL